MNEYTYDDYLWEQEKKYCYFSSFGCCCYIFMVWIQNTVFE